MFLKSLSGASRFCAWSSDLLRLHFPLLTSHDVSFTAWYLLVQGTGVYPHCDPWGYRFSPDYMPDRWSVAGTFLLPRGPPLVGCFAGVQGDQEYLKKIFKLKRHLAPVFCEKLFEWLNFINTFCLQGSYAHIECCHYCDAVKRSDDPGMLFTNFGHNAKHRSTFLTYINVGTCGWIGWISISEMHTFCI